MLRCTSVKLKLTSFVESTIRGGIPVICKGYAEANNSFLKFYNANKSTSYIIYLGVNNLYGKSMMHFLPTEILDWVNSKDFSLNCSNNSSIVCFLEFDLGYPDELHHLHNDWPLAGEKIKVTEEILFEYQSQKIITFS